MSDIITQSLLAFANWIHLISTVTWMGGIVIFTLVVTPSADNTLAPQVRCTFVNAYWRKLRPLVYFSIITFIISGFYMTFVAGNPYLYLDSYPWAMVSLIKHIVVGVLMVLGVYNVRVFSPKYNKLVCALPTTGPNPELERLNKLQKRSGVFAVFVVLLILLLSAICLVL